MRWSCEHRSCIAGADDNFSAREEFGEWSERLVPDMLIEGVPIGVLQHGCDDVGLPRSEVLHERAEERVVAEYGAECKQQRDPVAGVSKENRWQGPPGGVELVGRG